MAWLSESKIGVENLLSTCVELDLGSLSEVLGHDSVSLFAVNLGQHVEIVVQLLILVLIIVHTHLVVVRLLVLPLLVRRHIQQLHEVFDFDVAILVAQGVVRAEEPVLHHGRSNHILLRIELLLFILVAIIFFATILISFTFFVIIFVSFVVFSAVMRRLFWFRFRVEISQQAFHGGSSSA